MKDSVPGMDKPSHGISGIAEIESAAMVTFGAARDEFMDSIAQLLSAECIAMEGGPKALECIVSSLPDLVLVGPADKSRDADKFYFCRQLRGSAYKGIVVLVTCDTTYEGGTSYITGSGFDNYLIGGGQREHITDSLNWAILNRRRKNKYIIQFDCNPDAFYTVDASGRIYDINVMAVGGSGLSPRRVVVGGINIRELGTLRCFDEKVMPHITIGDVGRTFTFMVEEDDRVYQVMAGIHNVATIGLVAAVIRTDITRTIYSRTMDILANSITMLSERDNYTAGHSARVFHYVRRIAEEMGLGRQIKVIRPLYFASLLHDIGKVGVRDNVLLKPGALDEAEFIELAAHSEKGARMLEHYEFLRDCLHLVRTHHERPDGRGYPAGLAGDDIPLGAMIIGVADGFDAMTSTRPYRKAMSYEKAVSEIKDHLGVQFHAGAARAFLSFITPQLVDEVAELSEKPLISLSQELLDMFA